MYDEFLLRVQEDQSTVVSRVDLAGQALTERQHLQEWVLRHPEVLGPGVAVVTTEFDKWQTSSGTPVLDRLDVLGIDREGRLVVAELKRDQAPHSTSMQAITYAAMVSRLQPRDVADLYAANQRRSGTPMELEAALAHLESERLMTKESLRSPRIVLVASSFPASVTASVVWLNEQGVDIALLRYQPYRLDDGQLLVSFSRLFPVPDVEEFTINRRVEDPATSEVDPGAPWDEPSLRRLSEVGNDATLAVLDLCAQAEAGDEVGVQEVAQAGGISEHQVRGQLAGLSMLLRNANRGFAQKAWPVRFTTSPTGKTSYSMDPGLAAIWLTIRPNPLPPNLPVSGADSG